MLKHYNTKPRLTLETNVCFQPKFQNMRVFCISAVGWIWVAFLVGRMWQVKFRAIHKSLAVGTRLLFILHSLPPLTFIKILPTRGLGQNIEILSNTLFLLKCMGRGRVGEQSQSQFLLLAQIYQVPKTLGNGLSTLKISIGAKKCYDEHCHLQGWWCRTFSFLNPIMLWFNVALIF